MGNGRNVRLLTAAQHREMVAAHRPHESGNHLVNDLLKANNDLHELIADLLDAQTEASMMVDHWRHLQPSNAVGDVWIDAVEVAMIETRVAKFDRCVTTIERSRPDYGGEPNG